ncbi:MAG: amino acid racemase [bacterium]|nr:amino acid racemase [bacterium]
MKTVGLIGGMSWTSTERYYRALNLATQDRLGGAHSLRLVLWSVNFQEHLAIHDGQGWGGVRAEMIDAADRLRRAGAEVLALGVNTVHMVADDVERVVGLPVVNMVDAVGAHLRVRGLTRAGLLGTRHTLRESFYVDRLAERHGIEVLIPDIADIDRLDDIIYQELAVDRYRDEAGAACGRMIDTLQERGAACAVLACTELPRLMENVPTACPLVDTLQVHVESIVEASLGGIKRE